jgi:hypothetical protein
MKKKGNFTIEIIIPKIILKNHTKKTPRRDQPVPPKTDEMTNEMTNEKKGTPI